MATIYDVARRAGVSTYTVSAVVNRSARVSPELTERVNRAVSELNYKANELARSLPLRRTRTIGMLIPDIANPFYAKVVRGVEEVVAGKGYTLLLASTYNSPERQAHHLGVLSGKQADGLIVFFSGGDESEFRRLTEQGKAIVFAARTPSSFEADCVLADNRGAAHMATSFLAGRGHCRIAILLGQLSLSASRERAEGWRAALAAHGLECPYEYLAEGDWTAESAERLTGRLLDLPTPPTALLAANFLMMTGVLRTLQRRGVACPSEVEVMSWDDSDWLDLFSPAITTVVTSSYEMGRRAAELLLARLGDAHRPYERIVLTPELRVR
jgi:LacI family transcriptional regulator